MGLPADEDQPPFEYGSDCYLLTPDLWLPDENPKYISGVVNGISLCPYWIGKLTTPIPNGVVFNLEQSVGYPCIWSATIDNWFMLFKGNSNGSGESGLELIDPSWMMYAFWGHGPSQSSTNWTNIWDDCVSGQIGINGGGRIY